MSISSEQVKDDLIVKKAISAAQKPIANIDPQDLGDIDAYLLATGLKDTENLGDKSIAIKARQEQLAGERLQDFHARRLKAADHLEGDLWHKDDVRRKPKAVDPDVDRIARVLSDLEVLSNVIPAAVTYHVKALLRDKKKDCTILFCAKPRLNNIAVAAWMEDDEAYFAAHETPAVRDILDQLTNAWQTARIKRWRINLIQGQSSRS